MHNRVLNGIRFFGTGGRSGPETAASPQQQNGLIIKQMLRERKTIQNYLGPRLPAVSTAGRRRAS